MRREEVYQQLKSSPKNVRFTKICRAAELFGFSFKGGKGSHRIYKREGIIELLNFQNVEGKVPSYQVKQLLKVIDYYDLRKE